MRVQHPNGRVKMRKAARSFARFWDDESGASAAEYVVILALVGTGLFLAIFLLSGAISGGLEDATEVINAIG